VTAEAPTTIPAGLEYGQAEALARRMSDLDLLRVARGLSFAQCDNPAVAANQEVNRRFERLREQAVVLKSSMDGLNDKHTVLQERFDTLLGALQRALALLAGREPSLGDPDPAGA
jgi:hypothetical protein